MSENVNFFKIISVKNLSYSFGNNKALDDISFSVEAGSYTAIVGANGSGKSTLCRLISGLIENQSGQIEIAEGKRIGLVFQSPKDQIVSSKVYRDTAFGPQNLKLSADEVELRSIECLSLVELLDKAESPSNALSLGQTQKLAFAGMLAVKPDILILDEATAMLDPSSRQTIYEVLQELNRRGNTIIHITHDLDAVKECRNVIGLEKGRIFYEGPAGDFLSNKELVQKVRGAPLNKGVRKDFSDREVSFSFEKISFAYADPHKKRNEGAYTDPHKKGKAGSYTDPHKNNNSFLLNNISFSSRKPDMHSTA